MICEVSIVNTISMVGISYQTQGQLCGKDLVSRVESLAICHCRHGDHELWSHQDELPGHFSISKILFRKKARKKA